MSYRGRKGVEEDGSREKIWDVEEGEAFEGSEDEEEEEDQEAKGDESAFMNEKLPLVCSADKFTPFWWE